MVMMITHQGLISLFPPTSGKAGVSAYKELPPLPGKKSYSNSREKNELIQVCLWFGFFPLLFMYVSLSGTTYGIKGNDTEIRGCKALAGAMAIRFSDPSVTTHKNLSLVNIQTAVEQYICDLLSLDPSISSCRHVIEFFTVNASDNKFTDVERTIDAHRDADTGLILS